MELFQRRDHLHQGVFRGEDGYELFLAHLVCPAGVELSGEVLDPLRLSSTSFSRKLAGRGSRATKPHAAVNHALFVICFAASAPLAESVEGRSGTADPAVQM
jgi:hypothetical protein